MNEDTVKAVVAAHAAAVVAPMDVAHIQADLIPEMHPQIPAIAELLPAPVTHAAVTRLDVAVDHAVAVITYTGPSGTTAICSRWEDRGGTQPQMVDARPV